MTFSKSTNNELIFFSVPINIEVNNKTGVVYSYKNNEYFDGEIKNILTNAIKIMGITKKSDLAQFKLEAKVDTDALRHKLFYERYNDQLDSNGELDKELLNHAFKATKAFVDTINIINQSYSNGVSLMPRYDPNIANYFEIDNDEVIYQNKRSLVLINDFLNLQPKLPEKIIIGSKGIDIPFKKTAELAPPLKKKTFKTDKITIKGNVAALQYFPCRNIKIREGNSYPQRIRTFEITKTCCNFLKFIKLNENAEVLVELELSSTTDQYNIIKFNELDQNKQTIEDLFNTK